MNKPIVKTRRITHTAQMPHRGSEEAAGYDLYADTNMRIDIAPHESVKVGTGLAMEIPKGFFGAIFARSGVACRQGLRPSNCVGVIDSDYRGEIMVDVRNDTNEHQTITKQMRIAQLVIMPYLECDFEEVKELDDTQRGNGGYGSTGV